ncbi:MAG: glycosyltransferase family 4 protein [Chloroflexota bacterium]
MRILTALTYYRPHTSGLTIYVERLTRALARRGHQVTVLTSQYDHSLPRDEVKDGVRVVRAPVILRISKGVIMPTIGLLATKLVLQNDVVHLHLPQFDAAGIALRGRLLKKPTVITYHCDLTLPPGIFNRVVNQVVHVMNYLAAIFTHRIVAYTQDFADHSPYLQGFADKVHIITPPVELPEVTPAEIKQFKQRHNPEGRQPIIGMAARLAAEKGVEVLLDALPYILEVYPHARVLFAGQYQDVLGEEAYYKKLEPRLAAYRSSGHWEFLGVLTPGEMAAFYPNLDVLVVSSLNATESFGLVQIEAMMNGVPVVASNLPGVRQPVRITGMGEMTEIGDAQSLAAGLLKVLRNPKAYKGNPAEVRRRFSPDVPAEAYEVLFGNLLKELRR